MSWASGQYSAFDNNHRECTRDGCRTMACNHRSSAWLSLYLLHSGEPIQRFAAEDGKRSIDIGDEDKVLFRNEVDIACSWRNLTDSCDMPILCIDGHQILFSQVVKSWWCALSMARPPGPVQGVSCQDATTFFAVVSIRVISPSAGNATKTDPLPSPMADPGRPERGIVAMTWLDAASMTVTLWPRELKTKTDFEDGSKTMASGIAPVGSRRLASFPKQPCEMSGAVGAIRQVDRRS